MMTTALFARTDTARADATATPPLPAADRRQAELAIVHGEVAHARHRPKPHAFTYPAFCLQLPLSQLAALPARGIAYNARGAVAFHDRDHGACDGSALSPWIRPPARRRGHRRRRRGRAVRLSPHVRLRLQPGLVLGLPRPRGPRARGAVRGLQHVRRAPQLPAGAPGRTAPRLRGNARRAQGLPRLAVLRRQGPVRIPLPLRRAALARAHRLLRRRQRRCRCSRRASPAAPPRSTAPPRAGSSAATGCSRSA